jgi:hypothetical protein
VRALGVEGRNSKILRESGNTTCGESTLGTPVESPAFGNLQQCENYGITTKKIQVMY